MEWNVRSSHEIFKLRRPCVRVRRHVLHDGHVCQPRTRQPDLS